MSKYRSPEYQVPVELLQPGVFIRLEGAWFTHPFLFNNFKIKSEEQIDILKDLGVAKVVVVPEKSDVLPRTRSQAAAAPAPAPKEKPERDQYAQELWKKKKERIERLKARREAIARTEASYNDTVKKVPNLMKNLMTGSVESVEEAGLLINDMVDSLLDDTDAAVHLVNIRGKEENIFYHSLNVAVLAMIVGSQAGLGHFQMRNLGMGSLFHDVGKNRIAKKVLKKVGPLNKSEVALIQLHPRYGKEIVERCGNFPPDALAVILQHHERLDGNGYPEGFKADHISDLARITAVVDVYDNLCNQPDHTKSLTPYQALSFMYNKMKNQLDMDVLAVFVRSLGVYPPGTVVMLSNQVTGLVVSVNRGNPLKPSILIYDPEIPKNEALILDMADDPDLEIIESVHPLNLPPEVYDYLSPRRRVTYYMEDTAKPPTAS